MPQHRRVRQSPRSPSRAQRLANRVQYLQTTPITRRTHPHRVRHPLGGTTPTHTPTTHGPTNGSPSIRFSNSDFRLTTPNTGWQTWNHTGIIPTNTITNHNHNTTKTISDSFSEAIGYSFAGGANVLVLRMCWCCGCFYEVRPDLAEGITIMSVCTRRMSLVGEGCYRSGCSWVVMQRFLVC